jgi:hypothetical protein
MHGVSLSRLLPGQVYDVANPLGVFLVGMAVAEEIVVTIPSTSSTEPDSRIFRGVTVTPAHKDDEGRDE